jgi:hypothetical protein
MTSNEVVSIMIFVSFAITLARISPARPLVHRDFAVELDGSLPNTAQEVFSKAVIISDCFSLSYKELKTKRVSGK